MGEAVKQIYGTFIEALRRYQSLKPPEGEQAIREKARQWLSLLFGGTEVPIGLFSATAAFSRLYTECLWRDVLAPGVLWSYTGPNTPARPLGQQTFSSPFPVMSFYGQRGEDSPGTSWFQFPLSDSGARLLMLFLYSFSAQSGTFPGGWWKRSINRQDVYGPITIEGDPDKSWRLPGAVLSRLQETLPDWAVGLYLAPGYLEEDLLIPRQKVFVDTPPSPPYYSGGRSYAGIKVNYDTSVVNVSLFGSPSSLSLAPHTHAQSGYCAAGVRLHMTPLGLVVSTSPDPHRGVGWGPVPLDGDLSPPALKSPFGEVARVFAEVAHLPDPYEALFGTTQPVLSLEALPPATPVRRVLDILQREAVPAFIARYRWLTRAEEFYTPPGAEAMVTTLVGAARAALALPPDVFLSSPVDAYGSPASMPLVDVLRQVGRDRRKTLSSLSMEYGQTFSSFREYLLFALPGFFPSHGAPLATGVWSMYIRLFEPLQRALHVFYQVVGTAVLHRSSGVLAKIMQYPKEWALAQQAYTSAAQALSQYRPREDVLPALSFSPPAVSLSAQPSPLGPPGRAYDYTLSVQWAPTPGLKTLSVYLRRILSSEDLSLLPSPRNKVADLAGEGGVAAVPLPYRGVDQGLAPGSCYLAQVVGFFEFPSDTPGQTVLVPTPTIRLMTPERRLVLVSTRVETREWRGAPYASLVVSPLQGGVLPKGGSVLVFVGNGDEVAVARVVATAEVRRESARVFLDQVFGLPLPLMFSPTTEPTVFRGDGVILLA